MELKIDRLTIERLGPALQPFNPSIFHSFIHSILREIDFRAVIKGNESGTGLHRRRFLALAGAAALLPAAASVSAAIPDVPISKRRLLQMNGYASDAETPLDALTTYLTSNDLFFVRHHWNPSYPNVNRWTLAVDGEVERPLRLTLAELKRMPRASATCVLQCAGNGRALYKPVVPGVQWRYGAVGNARWTGVRVRDLMSRAGLKAGARHIHTFGADKPPVKTPPVHPSVEIEKLP